jgi:hypothetical protein
MLEIIGISCIGVLWINAEPMIRLRDWILGTHQGIWRRLLECAMCSSFHIYFWYQLFMFQNIDILGSAICSILAEFITRKLTTGSL